jgi:hypothetical protein
MQSLKVLEGTSMCPKDARSIVLISVETCSKAILALSVGHGKSPCFLRCCFSAEVGVDYAASVFASVNIGKFLECAF